MPPVTSPGLRPQPAAAPKARPSAASARGAQLSRIRFRRAVTLLLMTLVLPGSAQLVAGRKEVGRAAIRVVLSCLLTLVAVVLLGLLWHGLIFWLMTNSFMLGFFRLLLCALAVGWALLFIDAWRLGQPLELAQKQRLWVVGINGLLTFSVVGTLLYTSHLVSVQRDFIISMFGSGEASAATHGRYNVLLLGGDDGADRWGMRPDSITVASIDEDSGQTVLFGIPRNMTNFPFPKGTAMAEQFPDGYDDEINSLSTFAADNKALFKGEPDPGVAATIQGVEGITGLKINYYAMVNLDGFRNFVSAMGGLTLNVREPIPVGRIGKIEGYVKPGVRKLNGFETLWYARSRAAADDYSRMARQKCVMNAMLQQLTPAKVITKFEALTRASKGLLKTNLPASELGTFAELAMDAKKQPVRTVSFVPPAINTGRPDIDKIRAMIDAAIDGKKMPKSEAKAAAGKPAPAKATTAQGFSQDRASTSGASKGNIKEGYAANASEDLTGSC